MELVRLVTISYYVHYFDGSLHRLNDMLLSCSTDLMVLYLVALDLLNEMPHILSSN
jgi:exosortase/archaeosortase